LNKMFSFFCIQATHANAQKKNSMIFFDESWNMK
jgi:hypothetical protein